MAISQSGKAFSRQRRMWFRRIPDIVNKGGYGINGKPPATRHDVFIDSWVKGHTFIPMNGIELFIKSPQGQALIASGHLTEDDTLDPQALAIARIFQSPQLTDKSPDHQREIMELIEGFARNVYRQRKHEDVVALYGEYLGLKRSHAFRDMGDKVHEATVDALTQRNEKLIQQVENERLVAENAQLRAITYNSAQPTPTPAAE